MFKALLSKMLPQTLTQSEDHQSAPVFKITENPTIKSDFEVTELSYEEYARFLSQDRKKPTKPAFVERRKASQPVAVERRHYSQGAHA